MRDLVCVLAVAGLLASVQVASFAGGRDGSQAEHCRDNLRRLTQAWLMYSDDNTGRLVPNTDDPDPWCAAVRSLLEPGRLEEARSSVLRLQSARSLDTMVGQMESVYGRMVAAT